MDFKDELLILAERVGKLKDNVKTEEATKTSFVLPFLQALGYDILFATMERRKAKKSTIPYVWTASRSC